MTTGLRPILMEIAHSPTRPVLVAIQTAITFALLVNAVFVIVTQRRDMREPTGMALDDIVWVQSFAYAPDFDYATSVRLDLERLQALPGVVAVSPTNNVPLSGRGQPVTLGTAGGTRGRSETAVLYLGTDRTLEVLGLKLLAGASFSPQSIPPPQNDPFSVMSALPPETLVTKALADRLFPDGTALGSVVYGLGDRPFRIIGIVDHMTGPWTNVPYNDRIAFFPSVPPGPNATYLVRTRAGERDRVMGAIGPALSRSQSGRILSEVRALSEMATQRLAGARVSTSLLTVVLVLVMTISALGVFASAMFSTIARRRQIGIRRAIGASQADIARHFLFESWLIATCAVAVGCVLAVLVNVPLSALMGAGRLPTGYFIAGAGGMWLISVLATFIPAAQASQVPPAVATRSI